MLHGGFRWERWECCDVIYQSYRISLTARASNAAGGVFKSAWSSHREAPGMPYADLRALAMLLSANSSVLREVAIFIRMWLIPVWPHHDPATMWTFALFTK